EACALRRDIPEAAGKRRLCRGLSRRDRAPRHDAGGGCRATRRCHGVPAALAGRGGAGMSRKKRRPVVFTVAAIDLVAADEYLTSQHAIFSDQGYELKTKARCYRRRNGSITVQLNWTKSRASGSDSYTMTIRGA